MASFKITHLFNGARWGFSETWYCAATSLEGAQAIGAAYVPFRTGTLAGSSIVGMRVGPADPLDGPAIVTQFDGGPAFGNDINDPMDACLVTLIPTSGRARKFAMRGLPDVMVVRNQFNPNTSWRTFFAQWSQFVGTNFALRTRKTLTNTTAPLLTIDANGIVTYSPPLIGVAVGSQVFFTFARDSSGRPVSGVYKVADILTASTFRIGGWIVGRTASNGTVNLTPFGFNTFSRIDRGGLAERKVGRPFDLSRGLKRTVPRGLLRTGR